MSTFPVNIPAMMIAVIALAVAALDMAGVFTHKGGNG